MQEAGRQEALECGVVKRSTDHESSHGFVSNLIIKHTGRTGHNSFLGNVMTPLLYELYRSTSIPSYSRRMIYTDCPIDNISLYFLSVLHI
jgi:hypothetical protein